MLPWLSHPWALLVVSVFMLPLVAGRMALRVTRVIRLLLIEARLTVIDWRALVEELRPNDRGSPLIVEDAGEGDLDVRRSGRQHRARP
jgi:hypothetical protein